MDSFKAYFSRQDYSRGDTILSTHDSIDEIRQIDSFLPYLNKMQILIVSVLKMKCSLQDVTVQGVSRK